MRKRKKIKKKIFHQRKKNLVVDKEWITSIWSKFTCDIKLATGRVTGPTPSTHWFLSEIFIYIYMLGSLICRPVLVILIVDNLSFANVKTPLSIMYDWLPAATRKHHNYKKSTLNNASVSSHYYQTSCYLYLTTSVVKEIWRCSFVLYPPRAGGKSIRVWKMFFHVKQKIQCFVQLERRVRKVYIYIFHIIEDQIKVLIIGEKIMGLYWNESKIW